MVRSSLCQSKTAPGTGFGAPLSAVAVSWTVAPMLASDPNGCGRSMLTTGAIDGSTVIVASPVIRAIFACTCVDASAAALALACTWPVEASMVATFVSSHVQLAAAAPATGCRCPSSACAVKVKSASGAIDCDAGATLTECTACATMMAIEPGADPEVAVTWVLPLFFAGTRPLVPTASTVLALESQVKAASGTATPRESVAAAVSWRVSPMLVSAPVCVEETVMLLAAGTVTARLAVADFAPNVAAMVTAPVATPVATPLSSMIAIEASLEVQATAVAGIVWPFESTAAAVNVVVAPRSMLALGGVTAMLSGACETVTVTRPAATPTLAVMSAVPFATAVTSPLELTVATDASLEAQLGVTPVT